MCRKTVKNHKGTDSRLCFIFSCPGLKEIDMNKPCAGDTGDNLDAILKIANGINNLKVSNIDRYCYSLGNSSIFVHAKTHDSTTEPLHSEIKNNIRKLKSFINSVNPTNVVFCGRKAQYAKTLLDKNKFFETKKINVIMMPHLGNRGINSTSKYTTIIGTKNTKDDKLEALADYLVNNMV